MLERRSSTCRPHIASSLSASTEEATWALTSYLVANAIVCRLTGWLEANVRAQTLIMWSVTGFTLASFLCGAAPNLAQSSFPSHPGNDRRRVSTAASSQAVRSSRSSRGSRAREGFGASASSSRQILGPVLGGWLTEMYSWALGLLHQLPVGIAVDRHDTTYVFDPPYLRRESGRVDYWGIGMLALGIGALQFVLDTGSARTGSSRGPS